MAMGPSSATQRKKSSGLQPSTFPLTEVPSQKNGSSSSSTTKQPPPSATNVSSPVVTATVRRRRCGTSPFDDHWLNLDCCGLFCAGFTYMLHIYGCYAVCSILIPPWMSYYDGDVHRGSNARGERHLSIWGILHCVAFCGIAMMAILSHFKAMTTDPGAVPPDAAPLSIPEGEEEALLENGDGSTTSGEIGPRQQPPRRGRKLCRRCNAFKPKRAHHCSICRRCIIKMDHHCPWVNNCVGIGNHKFFLLFIFYTFLSCMYSLILLVARFVSCMNVRGICLSRPTDLLPLVGLVVEAMLFGLFTSCMMVDQWDVVMTNVTHIDRLKGEIFFDSCNEMPLARGRKPPISGVNEVFGSRGRNGFRPDWLSPFAKVCFPGSIQDEIMGFCISRRNDGVGTNDRDMEMAEVLRGSRTVVNEIV